MYDIILIVLVMPVKLIHIFEIMFILSKNIQPLNRVDGVEADLLSPPNRFASLGVINI